MTEPNPYDPISPVSPEGIATSKGHLFYADPKFGQDFLIEYYFNNGDIYKAVTNDPIQPNSFQRVGAWVCSALDLRQNADTYACYTGRTKQEILDALTAVGA